MDLIKTLVIEDGLNLKNAGLFKDNIDIVKLAVSNNRSAFQYASERLQKDKDFIKFLIKEERRHLGNKYPEIRSYEEEKCSNIKKINNLNDYNDDGNKIYYPIEFDDDADQIVDDGFFDNDLDFDSLLDSESETDDDSYEDIFKKDKYIEQNDEEKTCGIIFSYISSELKKNYKFKNELVYINPYLSKFINSKLSIYSLIETNPCIFMYYNKFKHDKEIIIEYINDDIPQIMVFIDDKLANDEEFIIEAIQINSKVYKYINKKMAENRKIIVEAKKKEKKEADEEKIRIQTELKQQQLGIKQYSYQEIGDQKKQKQHEKEVLAEQYQQDRAKQIILDREIIKEEEKERLQKIEENEKRKAKKEDEIKELENEEQKVITMYNVNNFIKNRAAMMWALDHVIGTDTEFDGNTQQQAQIDIVNIMQYVIEKKITTEYINQSIIEEFTEKIKNIIILLNNPQTDIDNKYYMCGWPGHNIMIFFEPGSYGINVGIINAGMGAEYQGINNEYCNGILICNNISRMNATTFMEQYIKWYNNKISEKTQEIYYMFYMLLLRTLYDNTSNNIDLKPYIENGRITVYKTNTQLFGNCTLINTINYIMYMLIKTSPEIDYLQEFQKWYMMVQIELKKCLYYEIGTSNDINLLLRNYNILYYIYDSLEDVPLLNFDKYKQKITDRFKIIPDRLSYSNTLSSNEKVNDTISRSFISPNEPFLWQLFTSNNNDLLIQELETNMKQTVIKLFAFYNSLHNNNCLIGMLPYIPPLLELFKLKFITSPSIHINDDILFSLMEDTKFTGIHDQIIYKSFIIALINNKSKYSISNHKDKSSLFKQLKKIFGFVSIVHGKYYSILDTFMNNHLYKYIYDHLPEITNNKFGYYIFKLSHNSIFDKFIKPLEWKNEYVLLKYNDCNLLVHSLLYNSITFMDKDNINKTIKSECITDYNYIIYETLNSVINMYDSMVLKEKNKYKNIDFVNIKNRAYTITTDTMYNYKDVIITLIFDKYHNELIDHNIVDINNEILFKYIIFFYLCLLKNINFTEYNELIEKYHQKFIELYCPTVNESNQFHRLISTYILYLDYELKIDPYKFITIDHMILISQKERKYFKQNSYYYKINDNNLCETNIVDFQFYMFKLNSGLTILLYSNENTIESINFIKANINYMSSYLILNFNYDKNGNGVYKMDKNITIKFNKDNKFIFDVDNTIILNESTPMTKNEADINYSLSNKIYNLDSTPDFPKTFYHIDGDDNIIVDDMKIPYNNYFKKEIELSKYKDIKVTLTYINFLRCLHAFDDIILESYDPSSETLFIMLHNYNLKFIINGDIITININNIIYNVKYFNSDDTRLLYGIFELEQAGIVKLLCLYNYKLLYNNSNPLKDNISFITASQKQEIIPEKYKRYYYVIIDKYENKYIVKNEDDVNAILLNCFIYNNAQLLLKTMRQIQTINSMLLNYIIYYNISPYALPILSLLNNKLSLTKYNYNSYNKLYIKYNIPVQIDIIKDHSIMSYVKLKTIDWDWSLDYIDIIPNYSNYKIYYDDILKTKIIDINIITNVDSYHIKYMKETSDNVNIVINKNIIYIDNSKKITDITLQFKNLCSNIITGFTIDQFDKNIITANKLFNYLISTNKQTMYPILEILMGQGKSSNITPYICLLLLNYFQESMKSKNEIYIVMPTTLITQSFITIMTYVFTLNQTVQIFINDNNKSILSNTTSIYLMDDTNYKLMFLKDNIDTINKYMIYDEVDMIANPIKNELNIPIDMVSVNNIDKYIEIFNILYEKIIINEDFWENDMFKNIVYDNKIHNYLIKMPQNINTIIKTLWSEFDESDKIHIYILKIVIPYILTKQYKLDYGIPNIYPENMTLSYKFKAIPYLSGNNPAYGSQFSDPILLIFLTLLSYKHMTKKSIRLIDKNFILEYYLNIYDDNKSIVNIQNILDLFKKIPKNIELLIENKDHYINLFKDDIVIKPEILKEILIKNYNYNERCKNISFTDMMLYRNIKNFICFTGTAYINVPRDNNHNYSTTNFIERSRIKTYENTEEAIKYILSNSDRTKSFYKDKNKNNINTILKCLLKISLSKQPKYHVLIDTGAFFINYNNEDMKNFIRDSNYKYFIYFEDGIKIYNYELDKYELSISKSDSKLALFYFNNKNITGVDAKTYMAEDLHGLVTISSTTNLRDFSQGIYRLRNILETQSIDIIIQEEIIEEFKGQRTCPDITIDCVKEDCNLRDFIFNYLKKNNDNVEKIKNKFLFRQNILALLKDQIFDYKQYLYIELVNYKKLDYTDENINIKIVDPKLNSLFKKYAQEDIIDINIYNIYNIYRNDDIINLLITDLFSYDETTFASISMEQEQEQEQNTSIISNIIQQHKLYISEQKIEIRVLENNIIMLIDNMNETFYEPISILYDNINNTIYIFDNTNFLRFISYINIENFTILSIYTNEQFNKKIKSELVQYIIIIAKIYYNLDKMYDNKYTEIFLTQKEKTIMKSSEFISFYHTFTNNYINNKIDNVITTYKMYIKYMKLKYIKYKNKYLKLKN
jgi:hypothetical protein